MVIFNSYVKLPEGIFHLDQYQGWQLLSDHPSGLLEAPQEPWMSAVAAGPSFTPCWSLGNMNVIDIDDA